jgi:hypothetical protein
MLATAGAATLAALCMKKLMKAAAPATVAIVRGRDYARYLPQLSLAFDRIGGIEKLVRGKTVALKLNLTGDPSNLFESHWPNQSGLPI